MASIKADPEREERIAMEIVVDAYTPQEVALGWYGYLENTLEFPFPAIWLNNRRTEPPQGETVEVVGMADEEDCGQEIFVEIAYDGDMLSAPLSYIEAPEADVDTQQAIYDWHYWVNQGYEFGDDSDEEFA